MNTLYYGDNLDVLRKYIRDETVDASQVGRGDIEVLKKAQAATSDTIQNALFTDEE